ncbi:hypothetical protein [Streptomyces rishiriensis]|nr:hypothetical protein [Streptomyces rishiriensis]
MSKHFEGSMEGTPPVKAVMPVKAVKSLDGSTGHMGGKAFRAPWPECP